MAIQTATITATSPAYIDEARPQEHLSVEDAVILSNTNSKKVLLFKFVIPSQIKDKRLSGTLSFRFYNQSNPQNWSDISFAANKYVYDFSTIKYADFRDSVGYPSIISGSYYSGTDANASFIGKFEEFKYGLYNGFQLSAVGQDRWYTPNSQYAPTMQFSYSDDISFYAIGNMYPMSTYKHKQTLLSWSLYDTDYNSIIIEGSPSAHGILEAPTQTSATVKWRTAAGQTEHSISAGTNAFVTVPANTFTSDTVQWMVTATYSNGMTRSSEWKTISTVDSTPTVTPQTPRNTVIDGSTATEFRWEYSNDSGSAPTGYTLETSTDGHTWATLSENLNTDAVTYTAPANTFSAGQMYWRVKGYNADGVGSDWSAAISNIVIAAPITPAVSVATASPFPVITWQTTGQQGFEIKIDGVSSGVKFGTSQTYKWMDALPDGTHGAMVRSQNAYGVWSEWGGATFTVTNVPGDDITLTANASESVRLTWETDGTYDRYIVYRDGVKLAETTAADYTDHKAIGSAVYTVRGIYGDYYTMSNDVTAAVTIDSVIIRAEDGNEWLTLKFVAASDRHNTISHTQNVSYQHYSGATYPMATIGTARDYVYSFAVAFKDVAECKRFEELLGKVVTLKDAWQNCVTGVLDGYSIDSSRFYQSYGCTIRQVV